MRAQALACAGQSRSLQAAACRVGRARPCRSSAPARRTTCARGLLDSYRQQQQQRQPAKEPEVPVVESLLLEEGVHFTEDDTPCPTDCVIEVFTEAELDGVFRSARPDSLIVIDFFKTDCPACKVMAPSFHRLCKSASQDAQHVIFVKHNIYTEDDEDEGELTPLARRFKIKTVPQFAFLKSNGTELVESFATRDRARLMQAVDKHKPAAAGRWEADEA